MQAPHHSESRIAHTIISDAWHRMDKMMESSSEKALWQSVVMQALLDAMNFASKSKQTAHEKKTIHWFSMEDEDFITVCQLAFLDPSYIVRNARKVIYQHAHKRRHRDLVRLKRQVNEGRVVKNPSMSKKASLANGT
jgi:hypothetical protein